MGKVNEYRARLRGLPDWDAFLRAESGLPGPRGNLELLQAVAEEGDEALFGRFLTLGSDVAPTGSPLEFLAACGVVGLGRLLAEGRLDLLAILRDRASDPRWRVREAVAMALQRLGAVDMDALLRAMDEWSLGGPFEQRAAAAALCEPALLREPVQVTQVLDILDRITASFRGSDDRRGEGYRALRKGLAYCWSVAVAARPAEGKARMERWFADPDPDVAWIMRQNLGKARLARMDPAWVRHWQEDLHGR